MDDDESAVDQWIDELWLEIRERLPDHMKDNPRVARGLGFLCGLGMEKLGWRIISWLLLRKR
jgi:hypothetical protein